METLIERRFCQKSHLTVLVNTTSLPPQKNKNKKFCSGTRRALVFSQGTKRLDKINI